MPAVGSAGDPTLGGATLRVYNSNGSSEHVTIMVDAADWLPLGNGWLHRGPNTHDGPVKSVEVTADKLSVKGGKSLTSTAKNDKQDKFVGEKKSSPPPSCPPPPAG